MQQPVRLPTNKKGLQRITSKIASLFAWWPTYSKNKLGVIGLFVFILMITLAILAPVIAPHDPRQMSTDIYLSPNRDYLLGTTAYGQDIFSQLFYSARISLLVGILTAIITNTVGTLVGLIAGYFGGLIDEILMRLADILIILPRLPLLIILAQLFGPGITTMIIVISSLGWTGMARQIRAMALSLKEYPYIESTRALGASNMRIIIRHILPNVLGVVLSHYVMSVVMIILLETGLSFLGFGDPLRPSWGQMLNFAQSAGAFSQGAWWWWLPPGLCITLLCASMAFIGMTLNDHFVLRLRRGGRA